MIEISEFSKKSFKLSRNQLKELSKFAFYLKKYKDLSNPNLKIIDKKSFVDFHLHVKKPLYKQISKSLLVYVD